MRIATFISLCPGGGKRAYVEFIKLLSKNNEIDLYTLLDKEEFSLLEGYVKNIYTFKFETLFLRSPFGFLNIFLNFINLFRLNKLYRKIADIINNKKCDVAFIHHSFYLYMHSPGISRYLKIPNVYYCQEPLRLFYEKMPCYKKISTKTFIFYIFLKPFYILFDLCFKFYDRQNIKKYNLVLCNSFYSKEYIKRAYRIEARVHYLGTD
ncbi:MAG: glycosyltransferase family 4 protein, partial [Candidatus Omnitrophica bacterium]|nr:glycosyltransferase family 4 protein [Candidatus Omnitrophota bacterium]